MKPLRSLIVTGALLALAGCGGGGDSAPVSSTNDYPLLQAWANYVNTSRTRSFTITGTMQGGTVTGSGSATVGSLQAASFEGSTVLGKTTVVTGSFTASGQVFPYGSSSTEYYGPAPSYTALGYNSSSEYGVVTSRNPIPQTARINDTGSFYTITRYLTSNKSSTKGTTLVSYALQPDTANTALLKVIATERSSGGTVESTSITTFRMTPTGDLTELTEEYQAGTTALTLRY